MFTAPSRQFLRLAPSRLPWTANESAHFSRCCLLYGNEQHRGRGASGQPLRGTEAVESRDTFGSLSSSLAARNLQRRLDDDDDDDGEDTFREKIEDTLRPRPSDYLRRMNELVRRRDLRGALNLLDGDMQREFVKPGPKHFRVLIHACGKEGYHSRAFSLYREYRNRHFRMNFGILSDLFNACTNSPFPEKALEDANRLRKSLVEENFVLPEVTYNNMIKAFGRCGDLETAFSLVDEMSRNNIPITTDTFNHLLYGCVADKYSGFRHAILTWRKLLETKRVRPNLTTVNLLLGATRDCNVGDSDMTYDLMLACMSPIEAQKHRAKLLEPSSKQDALHLQAGGAKGRQLADAKNSHVGHLELVNRETQLIESSNSNQQNLLERRPNFDKVVAISGTLKNPQDRFLMIGGPAGFLSVLEQHKIKADVKTFSQMLSLVGNAEDDEEALITEMKRRGVAVDTGFMNQLLKKRCLRHDYEVARRTLDLMNRENIEADLFTFGILAMAVRSHNDSKEFIRTLDHHGLRLNAVIMTTLFANFGSRFMVSDMIALLQISDLRKVKPNGKMLQRLETFYTDFRDTILKHERKDSPFWESTAKQRNFAHEVKSGFKGWKRFRELYKDYLVRTEREMPAHPWRQFLTSRDIEVSSSVPAVADILQTTNEALRK